MNSVQDFGDATMASLATAMSLFFAAIPKIIGFAIILIVGWFVASLIARAVAALLRAVHFNDLSQRAGLTAFVRDMGITQDASGFLAGIAKWFIRLIALVVAFDALGLPAVSDVLRQLLLWLPNLVVALVVLVVGGLAAGALSRVVRAASAEAGLSQPDLLGKVVSVVVWAFAVVVAVNQIGVATELVNTLFMATVGAVALALGLAFGLGGRDTASEIVHKWYEASREAAPRIERAVNVAEENARAGSAMQQPSMQRPNPSRA